jgi:hypothetical protein
MKNSCTEIPAYNPEEFAEAEDTTHRDTRVPAFDVGLLARAADVEATDAGFDLSEVPMWGAVSTGTDAIDHRAAFLLLNIDGRSSFETVIRLSHVPRAEALSVLVNMLAVGLITIRGREQAAPASRSKHESGMYTRHKDEGEPALQRAANDGECWTVSIR